MGKTYFKYRSLDNLERFLQIIMNRELYGALYKELNDPMEGYFSYNPTINPEIRRRIYHDRANTYICSASRKHNIDIMWSHYADEHRAWVPVFGRRIAVPLVGTVELLCHYPDGSCVEKGRQRPAAGHLSGGLFRPVCADSFAAV